MKLFWGSIIGWFIGCGIIAGAGYWINGRLAEPERVYSVRYGTVLCGNMQILNCGVRLSNCHDGRIYECLTDIRYDDDNK